MDWFCLLYLLPSQIRGCDAQGRQATIYARDKPVGQFGIIHPEVLAAFDILVPVSALELNLEPFAFDQRYRPLPTHLSDMQLEPSLGAAAM